MKTIARTIASAVRRHVFAVFSSWSVGSVSEDRRVKQIHARLQARDAKELAPGIDAYLLVQTAEAIANPARGASAEKITRQKDAARAPKSRACESRTARERRILKLKRALRARDVDPAVTAAVLIAVRDELSPAAIATQLNITVQEAHELLVQGICDFSYGPKNVDDC